MSCSEFCQIKSTFSAERKKSCCDPSADVQSVRMPNRKPRVDGTNLTIIDAGEIKGDCFFTWIETVGYDYALLGEPL